jgi:transcriptional regulator with XRE-family HTH domain
MSVKDEIRKGGRRMKIVRLKAGIGTQKELAILTGIAPSIISDLECGRRPMSPAWENRIAEAVESYKLE